MREGTREQERNGGGGGGGGGGGYKGHSKGFEALRG